MVAVVVANIIAQVASVTGIAVFPVIAPELAAELGVAPSLIGYQMSLLYGTALLGSPFLSFMITRWGACRTSQVGLGFCVVAMALGLTANLWGLAATSVLLGMAMSIMTPASAHLLFRFTSPKNRNFIFSVKQTGVPIGWTLMALVAPPITVAFGWRWALLVVLMVALATMLALQSVRTRWDDDRYTRTTVQQRPFDGLRLVWRYPVLRWVSASSLFLTFVQLCLSTFAVTMLVEEAGYSLVAAGFILSLVQASGIAGRVMWGWVADRTGDCLGLLGKLCMTMVACCAAMVFLWPSWPAGLTGFVFMIFGASAVGWNGLFLAEVARCSPRGLVSVATGGAMVWNFAGILIGPALFAAAYRLIGSYAWTYGLLSVIAAGGLCMVLLAAAAGRRGGGGGISDK